MVHAASIEDEPSMVDEASTQNEPSMVGETSIKDKPPMVWNIPTPTSYGTNYEYEDARGPTEEEGPPDLTTKPKKQLSEIQQIPLPTVRRKRVSNPKQDVGLIFTKEDKEDEAQKESQFINDTTVLTIKSGKPFPTWLCENINVEYVQQVPDLIISFKLYVVNTTPKITVMTLQIFSILI